MDFPLQGMTEDAPYALAARVSTPRPIVRWCCVMSLLRFSVASAAVVMTACFVPVDELDAACVGVGLATGAVRSSLSCPACFSTVRPEIVGP